MWSPALRAVCEARLSKYLGNGISDRNQTSNSRTYTPWALRRRIMSPELQKLHSLLIVLAGVYRQILIPSC